MTQEKYEFAGTVDEKQEKNNNGTIFYSLKIDGKYYSAWDGAADMVKDIPVGTTVKGSYLTAGKYKNIKTIRICTAEEAASVKPTNHPEEKTKNTSNSDYWAKKFELDVIRGEFEKTKHVHITREACWNTATDVLKAYLVHNKPETISLDDFYKQAQELAHKIEADVTRVTEGRRES